MTAETRFVIFMAMVASGCASVSPKRDLARVEELAHAPLPVNAVSRPVDPAPAEEIRDLLATPLTADSAVRIALLENRELRAALREVAVVRGRAAQAGTLPNPTFEIDLRHSEDRSQPLQKDFLVEYDVTRVLLAPLGSRVGDAEVDAQGLRAAGAAVDLGYRVRRAFYAWQASQQRLEITNRALDALAAGRDAARALARAGNVREIDLLAQEAAYEAARATAAEVELDVLERREALQRLLGVHGRATAWTASAGLPPPEDPRAPDDVEAQAVKASLVLAELRGRLEAIARRTGLARAEGWLPKITLDAHAEQDDGSWEIGGGARITIPLFDRRQGQLSAHEAEFDAILERYHGRAVDVRSAAREARDRLESSFRRARQYADVVVPARRKLVQHALRQFNAMAISVFDLLRFQRELLDTELAAADAARDYWLARAAADAIAAGWHARLETGAHRRVPSPSAVDEGGDPR